ncbi:mitochondrial ribonuclease P catalytic subunit isoform X1 [Dromiciops gliroides]|uniref:mitochondrial ribonuclease P catalytic subunit isoform X1 n=2 Tax=Dromiciops gliroides TaxID=33562 RepID=UPI001CC43443|nr:mitochondrial ribonuclease P catalytic subunit isoform X1 [Dromiciops gliroides]XP_043844687.1 mitochondrial ribonuclease P catalytic subunit isoform X1 [Dromiciops gliroides]
MMTFLLSFCRSFQILWKNRLNQGPGLRNQTFSVLYSYFHFSRKERRYFSLTLPFLQNTKSINLLISKTISSRKNGKNRHRQESFVSPHPLFSAGTAKKKSEMLGYKKDQQHCFPFSRPVLLPTKPLNSEEWEKVKENYEQKDIFENWMMAQMIKYNCSIDIAKSLLSWKARKNNGIVDYKLLIGYLTLCVSQRQTTEVIDVYEIVKNRYKTLELEGYTLLIEGLIHSDRWREALILLEDIKKVILPSKKNYGNCIKGALLNQEMNLAWNLYLEMLNQRIIPTWETFQDFFDFAKGVKNSQFERRLLDILLYLRHNQMYPTEPFAQSIKAWFESIPEKKWKGESVTIHKSGQCSACGRMLESIHLNSEEYEFLKQRVLKDVLDGGDQYRKTTPEEINRFENFIKSCPPFDIVIDGLNVTKMFPKIRESQTLLDVVSQLTKQNLKVLVLGRKHMLNRSWRWQKSEMAAVQNMAYCFFADNVSEDDAFLLYATLNSGNHCRFLTRDLLRDHKACLPDDKTRHLFFRWQQGHQLVFLNYYPGKKVIFQSVLTYDTVVQTTGDSWHIPYDEKMVERYSYEVPTKWLCLQQQN